MYKKRNKIPTR